MMSYKKTKKNNPSWLQVSDQLCKILITAGSELRKTNSLFNLMNQQTDIDKIYLYAKDPNEPKYQFLIN